MTFEETAKAISQLSAAGARVSLRTPRVRMTNADLLAFTDPDAIRVETTTPNGYSLRIPREVFEGAEWVDGTLRVNYEGETLEIEVTKVRA